MRAVLSIILISFLNGCSFIKPRQIDSLIIPEKGFELIQYTSVLAQRKNNSLYQASRRIEADEFNSKALVNFISELRTTMHQSNGIGIAANQVDKNIQVFLIEANKTVLWHEDLQAVPYQVFINPKITRVSKEKRNFWHGCLSAWGEKLGNVAGYDWIEFEAYDANGEIKRGRLSGLAAVTFQHEMRHLLGGTYLDKANDFLDAVDLYVKTNSNEVAFFEPSDDDLPLMLDDYVIGESLESYYERQGKK